MITRHYYDSRILAEKAGKRITAIFDEIKKPILFLVSGSSAFEVLDFISSKSIDSRVTITVLDERYSKDAHINNFSMLSETQFYKKALDQKAHFIDTRVNGRQHLKVAEDFERALKQWQSKNAGGVIVATMGMGPDGHTSGIMPFPENLNYFKRKFLSENWVAAYDAHNKNQFPFRVTTTLTFLKKIDRAVMFVKGENKRAVLKEIVEKGSLEEYPARIIHEMNSVEIFTDINE